MAKPAQHWQGALGGLFRGGEDRLFFGSQFQAQGNLDGPPRGRAVRGRKVQSQDLSLSTDRTLWNRHRLEGAGLRGRSEGGSRLYLQPGNARHADDPEWV